MRIAWRIALLLLAIQVLAYLFFYAGFWLTGLGWKIGLKTEGPAFGLALIAFIFTVTLVIDRVFKEDE